MTKSADLRKLLTPELRKKVEARQEHCYSLAEKHFKKKFTRPEVRYDIKNHHGGVAKWPDNVIRYNLILLFENEEHFIENTVPHEVAHLINRHANVPAPGKKKLMPHGKEWKDIMRDIFKLEPHVTHSYDVSSIQKPPRRKKSSKARVNSALHVIQSVLNRVSKRFTADEIIRFRQGFNSIVNEFDDGDFQKAA